MSKYGASYPHEWPQEVQDRVKTAPARWKEVLGDIRGRVWSGQFNTQLGGRKPFELAQESADGLQLVLEEPDRLAPITAPEPPMKSLSRRRRR